jgi:hypothetical protein
MTTGVYKMHEAKSGMRCWDIVPNLHTSTSTWLAIAPQELRFSICDPATFALTGRNLWFTLDTKIELACPYSPHSLLIVAISTPATGSV